MSAAHRVQVVVCTALVSAAAFSQPQDKCMPVAPLDEAPPLLRISSSERRVFLQARAEPCPPAPRRCRWRKRTALGPGAVVLAGAEVDGFRCVSSGARSGRLVAGFVPSAALERADEGGDLSAKFLAGTWTMAGKNPITFSSAGHGRVRARGIGRGGAAQFGAFVAVAELDGREATFSSGVCKVTVRRHGPYLLVRDNERCGGRSLRFHGIYVRRR